MINLGKDYVYDEMWMDGAEMAGHRHYEPYSLLWKDKADILSSFDTE